MATKSSSRLVVTLPSDREILMTRDFDAPRRLVFETFTKAEYLKRWWGPRGYTMPVCDLDFRPGGGYRFVIRAPDGVESPFKGEYREIVSPERLVFTQIYDVEQFSQYVAVVTAILTERDGKTTLTETLLCESMEVRDGMLQSGMEEGAGESLDRMAELLETMK